MDFHSVMETFAEAWVAANTHTPLTVAAEQGLINGPSNPTTPARNPTSLPVSSHGTPTHSASSHLPNQNGSTNGHLINDTGAQNLLPPNSSPIHPSSHAILQPEATERREVENSSEGEYSKVERSSEDSPSNYSSEIKAPFIVSKPQGKSLPVHCIIEQTPGPQACGQYVELDSYAIVPCDTLFNDLVRTALGKLGYSTSQILGAKGSIQIKKWKPLAFDQITENAEATVADILGELTTVASLHVRLYSVPDDPREWKDVTVRNAVLELLREMSQSKLAKLCPLSQPMLSNIINNRYLGKIGKEKCQEFGLWYLSYRKQNPEGTVLEVVPSDRPADGRLTFHPTKELPQMREWFHSCRNPSRRTLQLYVDILNQGPVRQQERPKVVLSTLKNWWKNEKQRERKQQKGDDRVDEPSKPKKKKKNEIAENSNTLQEIINKNEKNKETFHNELTSNKFVLINHDENENIKTGDKNNGDIPKDISLPSGPNSTLKSLDADVSKEDSSTMNYDSLETENGKCIPKDLSLNGNKSNGTALLSSKVATPNSNFVPKVHGVCIDHNHTLFPFSDPHLSIHNCPKVYCDNTSASVSDGNNSHVSSEEDVDVGI